MSKNPKKTRTKPSTDETKGAKFTRIVLPRVNKAVKSIDLIGNCAGSGYDYTPEQAAEIITVLVDAVRLLEQKFARTKHKQSDFVFKG